MQTRSQAGRSCCARRNASRSARFQMLRIVAPPTRRETVSPSRGWSKSLAAPYIRTRPSVADARACITRSKSRGLSSRSRWGKRYSVMSVSARRLRSSHRPMVSSLRCSHGDRFAGLARLAGGQDRFERRAEPLVFDVGGDGRAAVFVRAPGGGPSGRRSSRRPPAPCPTAPAPGSPSRPRRGGADRAAR